MFVPCPTCKKDCEPLIDITTLKNSKEFVDSTKAICANCKKELSITMFAKKSLFSMKKFYIKKPKKAFEYDCIQCNEYNEAFLKEGKAFCIKCSTELKLTPFMMTALKLTKKND